MKRTNTARAAIACVILAACVPAFVSYADAQTPAAGKKAPPKKKKGDKTPPADSATASAPAPETAPPPPPPPPETASAAPSAAPVVAASSAPVDTTPPPPAKQEGSWKTTAGIISIASGAVLLGGVYLFYKLNVNGKTNAYHAYAQGFPPSTDACDAAKANQTSPFLGADSPASVRKICSHSKTYTILEFTSLGLGVAAVGLGVYWLITAPSKQAPKTSWVLAPRVGDGAGLDFAMRF